MRFPFDEDDVVAMVRRLYNGRVVFHDGDEEIAPGVSVHHVGGHTMGMQIVRVNTRRGAVVLASDSSHLYANMEGAWRFQSRTTSAKSWRAIDGRANLLPRRGTLFRGTIRWC
jgi:glyoxylase-like metal-dependent hydrolase (beta-lactamase superfamily II)